MPEKRCIIIGLDGATFDLIDPWLEAGHLPTLNRLINEGVRGTLESSMPTLSAPAWCSFMTGKNPGKHGVLAFQDSLPTPFSPGVPGIVQSTSIDSETLWQVLSRAGRTVGVINVPVTYPPLPVNGFLISCFLTPPGASHFTYPPALADEIRDYKICIDYNTEYFFGDGNKDFRSYGNALYNEQCDVSTRRAHTAIDLLRSQKPDFFMLVFKGTDDMQHFFWDKPELLLRYYQLLDTEIARILESAGAGANTFLISDHGFGPTPRRQFNITTFLVQHGWLRRQRSASAIMHSAFYATARSAKRLVLGTRGTRLTAKVATSLSKSVVDRFDFSGMSAYGETRGICGIYIVRDGGRINLDETQSPEIDTYCQEIINKLRAQRDPKTGKEVFSIVERREERYHGPHLADIPEIVLLPTREFTLASSVGTPLFSDYNPSNVGGHHSHFDGILIAHGPDVRRGHTIEAMRLIDVAPTVMHMLNVPIPDDTDGRVLLELFHPDSQLAGRPVKHQSARQVETTSQGGSCTSEERESVEQRLRALGYIE